MIYLCTLLFSLLAFITGCDGTTSAVALPQQSQEAEPCSFEERGKIKDYAAGHYYACDGLRWVESYLGGAKPCPREGAMLEGFRCESDCSKEGPCQLLWTFILYDSNGCVGAESESTFVDVVKGTMTDPRDGRVYKTVTLGSRTRPVEWRGGYKSVTVGPQTWMAENLNYRYLGSTEGLDSSSFCYEGNPVNCEKYGRLYTWGAAMGKTGEPCAYGHSCDLGTGNVQGICPDGWRVANVNDWVNLFFAVSSESDDNGCIYRKLKSSSGWVNGNGTDAYSFSMLPAGNGSPYFEGYTYYGEGRTTKFWSYEKDKEDDTGANAKASYICLDCFIGNGMIDRTDDTRIAYSVRCVKDENVDASSNTSSSSIVSSSSVASSSSNETSSLIASSSSKVSSSSIAYEIGTMTDSRDGKNYKTVTIGSQTWMAENLNYEAKEGSYCYDEGDLKTENCDEYGRMYNWASAVDACPVTWRLPTRGEWEALLQFASGEYRDGFALKSSTGWNSDGNGGDVYGFSALPVACEYGISGIQTSFWSATESSSGYAYMLTLNYDTDFSALNHRPKVTKCPVRCIKDSE